MPDFKFSDLCNFSERQKIAFEEMEKFKYLLYGGAMGGGKSYWLRWSTARWLGKLFKKYGTQGIVGGLFCEDYPSLKDRQISKIAKEFPDWLGTLHADHNEYGRSFIAKPEYGGWVIALRNLDDASKYKSAEFAFIGIDELTKNVKETFEDLKTRLRWPGISSDDCKLAGATNPGEIGHAWVKKWWIDRDFEEEMLGEASSFSFVRAKATDNPHLDTAYVKVLDSLPEDKRRAYRDGDWDVFKGQYFSEWREEIHIVAPFTIPPHWKRFVCGDYGYAKPSAVYWCAVDEDGVVYVYRELYVTEHTYEQLTERIVSLTQPEEKISFFVFDPAIWAKKDGPLSGAEKMQLKFKELTKNGMQLIQANNDRVIGWGQVREYLRPINKNGKLMANLQVFSTCDNLKRTFPALVYDKHKTEDVDSDGEDHGPDAIRYGIMSRPPKAPSTKSAATRLLGKGFMENSNVITSYD